MIRQEGMRRSVIQIAVLLAVTGFIFKSFRRLVCSAAHFSKVARLRSSRHPGQAAEPLQVVLFEGEGVGEATGREVGRGPVRCVALPCPGSAALAGLPAASVPLRALFRPPANSTHLPPVSLFQAQLPL